MKIETHIQISTDKITAIEALANHPEIAGAISKQKLKQAMQKGAIWVTQKNRTRRVRRAKSLLPKDSELHIYYDSHVLEQAPEEATLIQDMEQYSVWHKPAGTLSQGSKFGDHCAIARQIEQNFRQPSLLVHRLDKAASGLILIAHSKNMAAKLSDLFQKRSIDKYYRVGVKETPSQPLPWVIDTPLEGKTTKTIIESTEEKDGIHWLWIKIETGRKHQIRQHLASVNLPVIGDALYGDGSDKRLLLQAEQLSFICPIQNKQAHFQSPTTLQLFNS